MTTQEAVKKARDLDRKFRELAEHVAVKRANRKLENANIRERVRVIRHSSPEPARFVFGIEGNYDVAGWNDMDDMEDGIEQYLSVKSAGMLIKSE